MWMLKTGLGPTPIDNGYRFAGNRYVKRSRFRFPTVRTLQEMIAGQQALGHARSQMALISISGEGFPNETPVEISFDPVADMCTLTLTLKGERIELEDPAKDFHSDKLETQLMLLLG
jgi:hypothetical protein